MDGNSQLEKEVMAWIGEAAAVGTAGRNMLATLSKGRTDDPVRHDAGAGYLGTGQLMRMG